MSRFAAKDWEIGIEDLLLVRNTGKRDFATFHSERRLQIGKRASRFVVKDREIGIEITFSREILGNRNLQFFTAKGDFKSGKGHLVLS